MAPSFLTIIIFIAIQQITPKITTHSKRKSISKQQQRHQRRSFTDKKRKKTSSKRKSKATRDRARVKSDVIYRRVKISDYDTTDNYLNIGNGKLYTSL
eukprot:327619_1